MIVEHQLSQLSPKCLCLAGLFESGVNEHSDTAFDHVSLKTLNLWKFLFSSPHLSSSNYSVEEASYLSQKISQNLCLTDSPYRVIEHCSLVRYLLLDIEARLDPQVCFLKHPS